MRDCIVIGIGGATCSGKTTLARGLKDAIPGARLISQDDYFWDVDDPRHTPVPELGVLNWEILESLDIPRMVSDVREIVGRPETTERKIEGPRVLILEGFLLFNCREIADLCDLRYFLEIEESECRKRRHARPYEPPDVPRYFELIIWPEYLKAVADIRADEKLFRQIVFVDTANINADKILARVLDHVKKHLDTCTSGQQAKANGS